MSAPIRWVISVDEETAALLERLRERYAPLSGNNRSALIRLLLKMLYWVDLEGEGFQMGECLKAIPVKLDEKTVARIDEDVENFAPFCKGRSTMVRLLVQIAHRQIDSGKVNWTMRGIQQALGIYRRRHKRDGK
jgi:hypothetical protein